MLRARIHQGSYGKAEFPSGRLNFQTIWARLPQCHSIGMSVSYLDVPEYQGLPFPFWCRQPYGAEERLR